MSEINLGNPRDKDSLTPCCGSGLKDKNYPNYPTMCVDDEASDRFKAAFDGSLEVDDEVELTNVKCRVSGVRHDQYGRSITLEVQSFDGGTDAGEAQEQPSDSDPSDEGETKEKEPMAKIVKKMPKAGSY